MISADFARDHGRRFWIAATVIALISGVSQIAHAQGKPVDVTKFDIGGVRLYMSGDEAVAALKQRYGANIQIDTTRYSSQYNPPAEYVKEITYRDGPYTLTAEFTEKFPPANDHREAATFIAYRSSGTEADKRQFLKSAREKYGPVSVNFGQDSPPFGAQSLVGMVVAIP
jgi:hypothetical protein